MNAWVSQYLKHMALHWQIVCMYYLPVSLKTSTRKWAMFCLHSLTEQNVSEVIRQPFISWLENPRPKERESLKVMNRVVGEEPPLALCLQYGERVCFPTQLSGSSSLGTISEVEPWSRAFLSYALWQCGHLYMSKTRPISMPAPKLELICLYKILGNVLLQVLWPLYLVYICPI